MTKEGRESKLMAATMATATNSMPDAWAERMSLEVAHKAGADSIPPPCLVAAAIAHHNQQHSSHTTTLGVCHNQTQAHMRLPQAGIPPQPNLHYTFHHA